jgi:group I intron endonuclease
MCKLLLLTSNSIEELGCTGVYLIQNKVNKKMYIGSASRVVANRSNSGFYMRWSLHISSLTKNKHHCQHLQRSWNKYGAENFEFSIMHKCPPEKAIEMEQLYIDLLEPQYNSCKTAGSPLGYKHSEESKNRMSLARKGITISEYTRLRLSETRKGVSKTEEHKKKISESHKGKTHTKETREKIAEKRSKFYTFISPEGIVTEIFNLHKFCKENNLKQSNMWKVANGKANHCKGWKAFGNTDD